MLRVEEAQQIVLEGMIALPAEVVPLGEAAGRILAEPIAATINLPPFANSSMDGYAIIAADLAAATADQPVSLPLVGEVPAGGVFVGHLAPGSTVRIFTGAPVPDGADAVMQQELTVAEAGTGIVRFLAALRAGQNIRPAGSDLPAGTPLLAVGTELGAPAIALLAAIGRDSVRVTRRPRVAIVATGNELIEPGRPLAPGQIYNSNTPMLAAAVRAAGGEPIILPHALDQHEAIRERFAEASTYDMVLSSGGVSVGDYDLVRQIVASLGQITLWRVNLRPGKPLAFGRIGTTPVLGLPGNPVSSAVTFELFARPLIRTLLGAAQPHRLQIAVRLAVDIPRGDRRHYVRARLDYMGAVVTAWPTGDQGSHRIASLLDAEVLAIIDEGQGMAEAGSIVPALLLR